MFRLRQTTNQGSNLPGGIDGLMSVSPKKETIGLLGYAPSSDVSLSSLRRRRRQRSFTRDTNMKTTWF